MAAEPQNQLARNPHLYHSPNSLSSRFGRRLKELRQEHRWTQTQMASRFGIDRSFISDVERGRKTVSLPTLEVIALGMKVSLSELFRDIEGKDEATIFPASSPDGFAGPHSRPYAHPQNTGTLWGLRNR